MSDLTPNLTLEARDFLSVTDVLAKPIRPLDNLNNANQKNSATVISQDILSLQASTRVPWHSITATLNHAIPNNPIPMRSFLCSIAATTDAPSARLHSIRQFTRKFLPDLSDAERETANTVSHFEIQDHSKNNPNVIIASYTNSTWTQIADDTFQKAAIEILKTKPPQTKRSEQLPTNQNDLLALVKNQSPFTLPDTIEADVIQTPNGSCSVHLRTQSSMPALDQLVVQWLFKRHATQKHRKKLPNNDIIRYSFEFRL